MRSDARIRRVSALVLRSAPLYENDRLVTLFNPKIGVVNARAKSAMEIKSRLAPRLMPLNYVYTSLVYTRSLYPIVSSAEPISSFHHWQKSWLRILISSCFLSLLIELSGPQEVTSQFFRLSINLLQSEPGEKPRKALAVFLVKAMRILGVLENQSRCGICNMPISKGAVISTPSLTLFFCVNCFNKEYSQRSVSFYKIPSNSLNKIIALHQLPLLEYQKISLSGFELGLLLLIFTNRVIDMFPKTIRLISQLYTYVGAEKPELTGG